MYVPQRPTVERRLSSGAINVTQPDSLNLDALGITRQQQSLSSGRSSLAFGPDINQIGLDINGRQSEFSGSEEELEVERQLSHSSGMSEQEAQEKKVSGRTTKIMKQILSNKELMELFPESEGEMPFQHMWLLVAAVGFGSFLTLVFFSGICEGSLGLSGWEAYLFLVRLDQSWFIFVGCGILAFFILHALNWYKWDHIFQAFAGIISFYVILIGIGCNAKHFPSAPLIVLHLQFPIGLALFRLKTRRAGSIASFFKVSAGCLVTFAFSSLLFWGIWVFIADMPLGSETWTKLEKKGVKVYEAYGIAGEEECRRERARPRPKSETEPLVLTHCSRVHLICLLIWTCPLIHFGVLMVIAGFCAMRYWLLQHHTSATEKGLRFLLFMLCFFVTSIWVAGSTAGGSMDLSYVIFAVIATGGSCWVVWLVFTVDLREIFLKARNTVIYKTVVPALGSDYFSAAMFCGTLFFIFGFLLLEFCVRQLERLVQVNESGGVFLTERGRLVAEFIASKHWASILEKSFVLSMVFIVFFLCSRFTPPFLSLLETKLADMNFIAVIIIFYVVGITMFLLPPVPGVPVYIAAGSILVSRGKQEPWLNFWTGIIFSSVVGLVLKLNAVAVQQKGIGEQFGKSIKVQQFVGVHTTSIRAIEKILKKPGLTLEKVSILVGGPDWPTSVLTGILRLSLGQMLIGTLPCFLLIVPCVLAGASLTDEKLAPFSPTIVLVTGVSQGATMLGALVFIAKETERSHDELSQPRAEHAALIQKTKEDDVKAKMYKNFTEWSKITSLEKCLLLTAAYLEIIMCWVLQFMGSVCFKTFNIGNSVDDPESEGGLNGNVMSIILGPGYAVFGLMTFGVLLFSAYTHIVRKRWRQYVFAWHEALGNQ